MALVNLKVGRSSEARMEPVLVGDGPSRGRIRWVHWGRGINTTALRVEWADDKRSRVQGFSIDPAYQHRGWQLVRDLYEGSPVERHFEDFMAFGQRQVASPESMRGIDFPEEFLPAAVLAMRTDAMQSAAARNEFTFADGSKLSERVAKQDETAANTPAEAQPKARAKPAKAKATSAEA